MKNVMKFLYTGLVNLGVYAVGGVILAVTGSILNPDFLDDIDFRDALNDLK